MSNILGLDLGSSSIGWAIREDDPFYENQIIDKGVLVFKKGVGEEKSSEFSRAAERRSHRSKRHLYNAKRYRKWATLKVLIENKMCPLSNEELNLWRIGKWENINGKMKNMGRIYPMKKDFHDWIKMDFDLDGKVDYLNPYILKSELTENEITDASKLYKIGRAMYHLTQRRGFKSNSLNKSSYGENQYFKKFYEKHPDKNDWTVSRIWNYLLSNADDDDRLRILRIRNNGVVPRSEYEKEFEAICNKQNISKVIKEKLYNAIYYVRPLKSQKGLVGKCTFENNKPRIPISHPYFEEFRAKQFINNIKRRLRNSNDKFEELPIKIKSDIFKSLFFRISLPYFKFEEIKKKFSNDNDGEYEFNFKDNTIINSCTVLTGIINSLGFDKNNIFVEKENEYGILWDKIKISYETIHHKENKQIELNIDGIWHLLFDFIRTKDNLDGLRTFTISKLKLDDEHVDKFCKINLVQGYASLSKNAIMKIMPFLSKGLIYTKAVFFANIEKVLGTEIYNKFSGEIYNDINEIINVFSETKIKINILNSFVQKFFADRNYLKKPNKLIGEINSGYIEDKLISCFGDKSWKEKNNEIKDDYINYLQTKLKEFINGKQKNEDKASFKNDGRIIDYDYYKVPKMDDKIKEYLINKYSVNEKSLSNLYHPSEIDIYPDAEEMILLVNGNKIAVKQLGNPQPPSNGFKNPMAMRTLYQLRYLINYLLANEKIDENTRIVIEIARELNDKNYRKAYTSWIKDKEQENKEIKDAIIDMIDNNREPSYDDYNKFACAIEQISEYNFNNAEENNINELYNNFISNYINIENNGNGNDKYLTNLILSREELTKMLNYRLPETQKWVTQIIKSPKGFREKRKELINLISKYRLWKEQNFQCLYTGRFIPFSELFTGNYQIEHTIPRSISFNSELSNLTICDSVYNNEVKSKRFPSECPNYEDQMMCQTILGNRNCEPIIARIKKLIEPKVFELEKRIIELKQISKKIPDWEKDKKDANIQLRHYLNFELQYWNEKLFTFKVKRDEWKDKFKNSQLVDTQIVSKYARAYLKSLFKRVEVQKGAITAIFREIYSLPPKSRDNHIHHSIDAAVLTLIPGSATRDLQMQEYFKWKENRNNNYIRPIPYETFIISHIDSELKNSVLINHISKDQTFSEGKKYARKRGKIEFIKNRKTGELIFDENGEKIKKINKGDSLRGQLHNESFFGAIKVIERDERGNPIKDEKGKYKFMKDEDENDLLWFVIRKKMKDLKISTKDGNKYIKDEIVDPSIKKFIENKLNEGFNIEHIYLDEANKIKIRHVRCRVAAGRGYLTKEKALQIKEHIFTSSQEHKKYYYAQNSDNYLYLLYEKEINGIIKRHYRIINYFDISNLKYKNLHDINHDNYLNQFIIENRCDKIILPLKAIIRRGTKIIMLNGQANNLENVINNELNKRLYIVYKFHEKSSSGYLYLQHHSESRSDQELGDGDNEFNINNYQARLKLIPDKFNFLIENVDFEMKLDGKIVFMKKN